MHKDIYGELERVLEGKVVILGIGNPMRGDDAFGSLFANRLQGKINIRVYDGGLSPENLLGKIIQEDPDTILVIDAMDFGGNCGEINLYNAEDVKTSNIFFTHNPAPRLVFDFLKEYTRAEIYLLAIQPKSSRLGEKMSSAIEEGFNSLIGWFIQHYPVKK